MAPGRVEDAIDALTDGFLSVGVACVDPTADPFGLEGTREASRHGVVPALSTRACDEPEALERSLAPHLEHRDADIEVLHPDDLPREAVTAGRERREGADDRDTVDLDLAR